MEVHSGGGRGSVNNSLIWEKNWRCITHTMLKSAMESDIFGLAELVVDKEGEDASKGKFVEGSVHKLSCREVFLKGARRDDDGVNLGAMVKEDRDVALMSWGRNAKDAKSKWRIAISIGRDESDATGLRGSEGTVVV